MSDGVNEETSAGGERTAEEIRADIDQTRDELGDTVEALAEKTDVKAQARDRIGAAKATVTGRVGTAAQSVSGKTEEFATRAREATPDSAGAGVQQVTSTVQQRPLPFAIAGAFIAGLMVGWLVGRR